MENFSQPEQTPSPEARAEQIMQRFYTEGGMDYTKKFVPEGDQVEEQDVLSVAFGIMQWCRNHNLLPEGSPKDLQQAVNKMAKKAAHDIIKNVRASQVHSNQPGETDPPLPKPRRDSSSVSEIPAIKRGAQESPAAHYVDPSEED